MTSLSATVYAASPSSIFDESIAPKFDDSETDLGLTEQLYTARGSQGLGTKSLVYRFGVDPENYKDTVLMPYWR